ncbi:sigma factor-like helix-turn-helix DNA-binding protein [Streptomyces sp. Tu6071]|uniref:sigma factor-like helix-turn-helix DNA-binding protein n=1 Tax=Streptomyces sp. Tu6071 TaxID=355249 RepID=UPI0005B8A784|nr:sigma factor-like helix-turn-helix DNA-binding protein [Streptomyces sp. Tu6071]
MRVVLDPALIAPRRPDLTFDAFADSHMGLWTRYAESQVGAAHSDEVVARACGWLRGNWRRVLGSDSVARYAWRVLKAEVHACATERGVRPVGEVSGAALAELPERLYDLVVLRYELGVGDAEIADYLGIEQAAVGAQARYARGRVEGLSVVAGSSATEGRAGAEGPPGEEKLSGAEGPPGPEHLPGAEGLSGPEGLSGVGE